MESDNIKGAKAVPATASKGSNQFNMSWNVRIALAVVVFIVFQHVFSHMFMALIYTLVSLLIVIWISFKLSLNDARNAQLPSRFQERLPRWKFLNNDSWIVSSMVEDTEALFPESFFISETVDTIMDYIIRDFIESWFQRISDDDDGFPKELKRQLRFAVRRLKQRLEKVDISNLIVLKGIPTLTEHFNNFVIAEDIAKSKKINLNNFDFIVASNFNRGKLHPAIKLKNLSKDSDRKEYIQKTIDSILPFLITKEEMDSSPVRILIKNLLVSCVVFPSVSMLCESDFWNQLIVNSIGAMLKDEYQVKKFRSILDLHSEDKKNDFSLNPLMKQLINMKSSQQQFEKIMRKVLRSDLSSHLKQLKYYLSLQLGKSVRQLGKDLSVPAEIKVYNKRLQLLIKAVDDRLEILADPNAPRQQNSEAFIPESLPRNAKLQLSLNDVLLNATSLTYFMEFMEQRNRTVLLQFWLTVNGIKSPLEDLNEYDDLESDDEELIAMSLSLDLSQSDDIKHIFNQFFDQKFLRINPDDYNYVKSFVESPKKSLELYVKSRKILLILQKNVYSRMERSDFVAFKDSDLFLRLLATEDLGASEKTVEDDLLEMDEEGDPLVNYEENYPVSYNEKVGENVVKAVEDALNEIMIDEKNQKFEGEFSSSRNSSSSVLNASQIFKPVEANKPETVGHDDLHKELFGNDSEAGLFDEMDSSFDNLSKKNSRLFNDVSDSEVDSSETASVYDGDLQNSEPDNEVQLAAPGDLNLEEEILKLSSEIERFEKQVSIIDPLLRKAEITNNIAELKILKKSRFSLEREIEQKELQKQQYIVQESDNSLYGKSRVRIQSYVPEDNFILYIIEVQKFSSENSEVATAGWVVPRRFSQFYKLHEYLKRKYPSVQDATFPKRKVVLKFQQTALIEERKRQLERYLKHLIAMPDVCSDKLFRSFLSSEVFAMELNNSLNSSTKLSRKAKVENVASKFYNTLPWKLPLTVVGIPIREAMYSKPITQTPVLSPDPSKMASVSDEYEFDGPANDMQLELNSFDDLGKTSFVKPICDLIISLFDIKKSSSWSRGRAVLVLLQQFLGTTIEKKVRENLNILFRTETKIHDIVSSLRDKLWPGGKFRERSVPRTQIEKSATRTKSKLMLDRFLVDSVSRVFGVSHSRVAANKIHSMLQNELILNNLVFSLYDAILEEVFPELTGI